MSVSAVLDSAGRRRSPATMPGYHAGRRETRGCATPPTRRPSRRSSRSCARPGRIATAPGYGQCSPCSGAAGCASRRRSPSRARPRRAPGSLLVRSGKGGRRREIGIDLWGWELRPWLVSRLELPIGSLFCIIDGPPRGRPWSSAGVRVELRRLAAQASVRRRFAPHELRDAHALELAREGVALNIIQRQLGHASLGTTSIYLQGIDTEEIIATVHARRAPMMSATAGLRL